MRWLSFTRAMRTRGRIIGGLGIASVAAMASGCAEPANAGTRDQHVSAPVFVTGDVTGSAQTQLQAAGVQGPVVLIVVDSLLISHCEDLARQFREVLHSRIAHNLPAVVLTPANDSVRVTTWIRQERIVSQHIVTYTKALLVGDKPVTGAAVLILNERLHVTSGVSHPVIVLNTRPQSFATELNAQ